jgi:autotransporter-associated beta strand protein
LSNTTVNLSGTRSPASIIVNNSSKTYTLSGSAIAGTGSLTKSGSGTLALSGANTFSGGVTNNGGAIILAASTTGSAGSVTSGPIGTGALVLQGGAISPDNGSVRTIANDIVVAAGTTNVLGSSVAGKNLSLTGALSGGGTLQNQSVTPAASYSFYLLGDLSRFSGALIYTGVTGVNGANWRVGTSGSTADLSHAAVELDGGNSKNFGYADNSSSLVLNLGSLSGNGYFQGSYNGGNGNILSVGYLNADAYFDGQLGVPNANMANFSLIKVGTGLQFLLNSIYTGSTTVSNGELLISTAFTGNGGGNVASGAVLGVYNYLSASAQIGDLSTAAGATLEFWNIASTNTPFMAAGNVTINGDCPVNIIDYGGLAASNSYPLISYSGALSGFANLKLQMPYGWRGALVNSANRILLANVAAISLNPPPLSCVFSNSLLRLGWPVGHTGWRLEMQTNSLSAGLGTNWVAVPGSSATNQVFIPIHVANDSVFFRLAYP